MTLRSILALALTACVLVQAQPAAAEGEADTGAFGAFQLEGTNGFTIFAVAFSKPRFKHGELVLFVAGKPGSAIYLAPAKVEPTTIEADLGRVGRIAVEFESSGPPERVPSKCRRGYSARFEPGAWVGTIDFRGEEGFTEVRQSRVEASISPFQEPGCGYRAIGETGGDRVEGARLIARSASARRAIYFQANKNRQGASVHLEASIEERRPGLIVSRDVAGYFPSQAFGFADPLRIATLEPPVPYSGHATFHRNAKPPNRWTGNLTVDFPGRADVPIAGRRFEAALGHWKRTEETSAGRLARPDLLLWPSTKPSPTALAVRAEVTEQEMFGDIAFMLAGNMAVGVSGEDLMVRLDPADAAKAAWVDAGADYAASLPPK